MIGRRLALLVAAGAAAWSVAAEAQPYPARPITIVVPYAAGGVFDTMARIIGARMGELLGQSKARQSLDRLLVRYVLHVRLAAGAAPGDRDGNPVGGVDAASYR